MAGSGGERARRTAPKIPVREEALRELLAWSLDEPVEVDEEGGKCANGKEYVDKWIGAWLNETRASVYAEKPSSSETVSVEIDSGTGGAFCGATCAGLRKATESDLVLLEGKTWRILALVVSPARRGRMTSLTLARGRMAEALGKYAAGKKKTNVEDVRASVVQSLTPALRELDAIVGFPALPAWLQETLLLQHSSSRSLSEDETENENRERLSKTCGPGFAKHVTQKSNASQLKAVVAAVSPFEQKRIVLVKGPPGTGKTTTTAMALNAIHVKMFQDYYSAVRRVASTAPSSQRTAKKKSAVATLMSAESDDIDEWLARLREARPRILVCAPSNVAIDNVVAKIVKDQFVGGNGQPYRPDVVRVGRASGAGPSSLDARCDELLAESRFSLEELKDRAEVEALKHARAAEASRKRLRLFTVDAPPSLPEGWEARVHPLQGTTTNKEGEPFIYFVDHTTQSTSRVPPLPADNQATMPLSQCSPELDVVLGDVHRHLESWTRARGRALACACALTRYESFIPADVVRRSLAARLLDDAEIVCSTLHGSGHQSVKDSRPFKCVVVDEAANALETAVLIPLARLEHAVGRIKTSAEVVLVGDPQQLAATRKARRNSWAGASLFERLEEQGDTPCVLLNTQYRMHPLIAKFSSDTFYGGLLKDGPAAIDRAKTEEYRWRNDVPAFGPLVFLDLATSAEEVTQTSRANGPEAALAASAYATLRRQFPRDEHKQPSVALVAFYREQLAELEKAVKALELPVPEINTVDAFQGREKDVIIVSCVRAEEEGGVGFLRDARRLNVAITRAKHACIVIGRKRTLVVDPLWRRLIDYAAETDSLIHVPGPHIDLLKLGKNKRKRQRKDTDEKSPPDDEEEDGEVVDEPVEKAPPTAAPTLSAKERYDLL